MTMRQFNDRDIHLALDGELPDEERAAYEAWLLANPDMRARAARFGDDAGLLRAAVAGVVDEPIPARVRRALEARSFAARRAMPTWWQFAAAVFLLAIGLAGGALIGRSAWFEVDRQTFDLAAAAIAAHNIYAAEKLHVVEVGADQQDHLQQWLSRRLDMALVAPDLSTQGLHLIGGRLLPAGRRSAAQFMYEDASGNRVSLYITRDPGDRETGFRLLREGNTRAVFWLDEGYGCAVAGSATDTVLARVADIAYRGLLAGRAS